MEQILCNFLSEMCFVSVEILNSFVEEKIISNKEKYEFLSTIKSVTTNIVKDFQKTEKKQIFEDLRTFKTQHIRYFKF